MNRRLGIRVLLSAVLAAGLALSVTLTRHHESKEYGDASVALSNCPETETVNCDTVNTSAWSEMWGIPIAVFAVPTYLLVLWLLWNLKRSEGALSYAFAIGLLTTLYSAFLFLVSSTRIGYICLYCVGLYGVNVAIPVLTLLAARRSPVSLIGTTLGDLRSRPPLLRATALAFVALLTTTLVTQHAYRRYLQKEAAIERRHIEEQGGPLVPAGPPGEASLSPSSGAGLGALLATPAEAATTTPAPPPAPPPAAGPYVLAGPVRRIEKGAKIERFDLQGKMGHGKPVALIFWAPGFRESERFLVQMSDRLHKSLPAFDVYAVAGRTEEMRDEEVFETATMLGVRPDLPLLIDDKFAIMKGMNTLDVPNLAVIDAKGTLIVSKIKALGQKLALPSGMVTAGDVLRSVAAGAQVPVVKQMAQYYPSTELLGTCAPTFRARKFDTPDLVDFKGKPSAPDKPLLLMFWSSTCKHCQVEVPLLVDWVKHHPGRVEIVSVSHIRSDKPGRASHRETTRRYIQQQHITWSVLEDPDDVVADLYRSISTPTTYFITSQGTVADLWFFPHPTDFDRAMEEALAKVKMTSASVAACRPLPESPAPRMAFDMLAPDGGHVTLASRLDRPALVHLWATWCAPCMQEIPSLLKFGDRLTKSGDGRLVMVSVEDASPEKIAGFAKKVGIPFQSNRRPSGGLAAALDLAYRLPRTYLVAPGGAVLGSLQGGQNWDDPNLDEHVLSRLRNAANLAR